MLINHTFQIKSNGFSVNPSSVRRQAATAFNHLKTGIHKSLSSGFLHSVVALYKQSPLLVGAVGGFSIVFFIIVVIIFSLAGGNSGHNNALIQADESLFGGQYSHAKIKYKLNVIALSLIEDDHWNKQSIADFTYGWNTLDANEKDKMKQTVWFQLLENTLMNKLSADSDDKYTKLLADLSAQLDLHSPREKNRSAMVNAETVKAEADKDETVAVEAPQAQALKTQLAQTQVTKAESQSPSASQIREAEATVDEEVGPLSQSFISSVDQPSVTPPAARDPQEQTNIMAQLPEFQSIEGQQNKQQVATASTEQDKPSRVNRVIRTPLPVEAQSTTGLTNVASTSPSSPKQSSDATPAAISETELQKITAEFISSYETGNIKSFTSLFAKKAVSNDEADLNTIKKEYASLFAATSDRRMIIGDLKWDLSKQTATGEGKLEVAVKSAGADKAQTYSGKIQIVVEKQDDGVQITKLFHALQ